MKFFYLFLLGLCGVAAAADSAGLNITSSIDLVGQFGLHNNSGASDKVTMRGAELMVYSPADHLFDGMLSIAAHDEGGISRLELHEAVVSSTKLIPRSRFRVGQYFLGVGRLNQYHQHDWPFITAPKVHQDFFADEGVLDTGVEYSYLLPTPFFLELTAGLTNGFVFGHDHGPGGRPAVPTNYLRAVTYASLPGNGGTQIGLNYLGRKDNARAAMTLLGMDVTAKWREEKVVQMLFQSEVWFQTETEVGIETQKRIGFYLYPEYYLGENFFAGLRFDYWADLTRKDPSGVGVRDLEFQFVPTLTYRSSEFALFRLAYNHVFNQFRTVDTQRKYVELQAVILLGAHPAHDF